VLLKKELFIRNDGYTNCVGDGFSDGGGGIGGSDDGGGGKMGDGDATTTTTAVAPTITTTIIPAQKTKETQELLESILTSCIVIIMENRHRCHCRHCPLYWGSIEGGVVIVAMVMVMAVAVVVRGRS